MINSSSWIMFVGKRKIEKTDFQKSDIVRNPTTSLVFQTDIF
jgi:hypothetical protein